MGHIPDQPVTQLLAKWRSGNEQALGELTGLVYQELRSLAQRHLRRERHNHTIQRTALVNEAFVRLSGQRVLEWQNREQFLSLAAQIMRRVLVDHARRRGRQKRGAAPERVPLEDVELVLSDDEADELVALDEALTRLEQINSRGSEVVQYRFFGGLTLDETAEILGVSAKTVQRDWLAARAWLRKEVARDLGILDVQNRRDSSLS